MSVKEQEATEWYGRHKSVKYLALLLIFLVPSIAASTLAVVGEASPEKRLLVDAAWLKNYFQNDSVLIIDVRSHEAYEQGHIRGAVNIPTSLTFRQNDKKYRVGSIGYIQELFGAAGIERISNVVLYDDGRLVDASRVFWILEVYGHRRVSVLDGGYPSWMDKGFDVSLEKTEKPAKIFFAAIQPEKLSTQLQTRLAINDPNKVLVDARSREEYLGFKSESRQFGHIPSSKNIPWSKNLVRKNNIMVSKLLPDLKMVYNGLKKDRKIITYCNKGEHSSFTYFVLRRLGYDVSHYDGSWLEWGNSVGLPIEK